MAGPHGAGDSEPEPLEETQALGPGWLAPGCAIGHYRIVEKLGQGGMGAVYLAVDERLDRPVAIKVIARGAESVDRSRRFAREAKAASALNHPNIVTVHEFGSDGGRDFIAMEFIEGRTLDELSRAGTPLATMLEYMRQLAGALAKAHEKGIVHRDLKPTNVMVTSDGAVKVLDFGLAKVETSAVGDETATELTAYGATIGTPWYMSPEQALGKEVDYRSDVFSFGIILYQIACGRRPFEGATAQATIVEIANCSLPRAAKACPELNPEVAALIDRCLQKRPEDRPHSMAEAAAVLGRAAAAPERSGGRKWIWALLVGLATVAVVAGGALLLSRRTAEPSKTVAVPAARTLDCALLLRSPSGEERPASPAETFRAGWAFRVRCSGDATGYAYIVNQGPGAGGSDRYWMLYPERADAPALAGFETGWLVFDEHPGTERLWVLQSKDRIAPLEECRRESRDGRIAAGRNADVAALLAGARAGTQNEADGTVRFRTNVDMVRGVLELNHR